MKDMAKLFDTFNKLVDKTDSSRSNGSSNNSNTGGRTDTLKSAAKPPELSAKASLSDFDGFVRKWTYYFDLAGVDRLDQAKQKMALFSCLEESLVNIVENDLGIKVDDDKDVKQVLASIKAYFRGNRNVIRDRLDFFECAQHEGEQVQDFITRLQRIGANCDFGSMTEDEQYVQALVAGCRDGELKEKILEKSPKSFAEARKMAISHETVKQDSQALVSTSPRINRIGAKNHARVKSSYRKDKEKNLSKAAVNYDKQSKQCSGCGRACTTRSKDCPAWGKSCEKCGVKNHFARVCRGLTKQQQVSTLFVRSAFLDKTAPRIRMDFIYKGKATSVLALPDSGAEASCMGPDQAKSVGFDVKRSRSSPQCAISSANRQPIKCLGEFKVKIVVDGHEAEDIIHVVENVNCTLVSWFSLKSLHILCPCYPYPCRSSCQVVNAVSQSAKQVEEVKQQLMEEFSDVFDDGGALKPMHTEEMKIILQPDAQPTCITAPRVIPYAWKQETKGLLDDMVERDIIEPVTEPSDWCAPLLVTPKPGGKGLRVCADLRGVNKYVRRPVYPLLTPREAVSRVSPDAKFFSTVDSKSGYWQVPLAKESRQYTTFISEWGRFRYKRASMGLSCSSDEYLQRSAKALGDLPRTHQVVDDILIEHSDFQNHVKQVRELLQRCRKHSITLNPKKFNFAQSSVEFAGYHVGANGVKADPSKLEAISRFPTPSSLTDLRSFLGLAEQLAGFTPQLAAAKQPLRALLSSKNSFIWLPEHDKAFQDVKSVLMSPNVLAFFDPKLPTALHTDASRLNGLGYCLLQQHGGGQWKVVQCGSRFLSPAETRYSILETEALGLVWATKKCNVYLQGHPGYTVVTDHRPLLPIFNHYNLSDIENARLQRLREKVDTYSFQVEWKKGSQHKVPDALSRAPVAEPSPEDELAEEQVQEYVDRVIMSNIAVISQEDAASNDIADPILVELSDKAKKDESYQEIIDGIKTGFSKKSAALQPYLKLQQELSIDGRYGLVLRGNRVLVPREARQSVLQRLHSSHQGQVRTLRRARQCIFWPGMSSDIKNLVQSCEACQEHLSFQAKEPLMEVNEAPPSRAFEHISLDFFELNGKHFLAVVDLYSGWTFPIHFPSSTKTSVMTKKLLMEFSRFGLPTLIRSDQGPQFSCYEFSSFCKKWCVTHRMSSPYHPEGNSSAELAVKKLKMLLRKTETDVSSDQFVEGILELNNTPSRFGKSPAQLLFGRSNRSRLPFIGPNELQSDPEGEKVEAIRQAERERFNKSSVPLKPFSIGDEVRLWDPLNRKWTQVGVVDKVLPRRNYVVKTNSGKTFRRNRRLLRPHFVSGGGDVK